MSNRKGRRSRKGVSNRRSSRRRPSDRTGRVGGAVYEVLSSIIRRIWLQKKASRTGGLVGAREAVKQKGEYIQKKLF